MHAGEDNDQPVTSIGGLGDQARIVGGFAGLHMTDNETARTAELFLTLKGKHSLMVVEHDMSFIKTISEIVTVLCDGSVLAQGTLDQVQQNEKVIEVYLGR